jgi:hypothetical protein
LSTEHRQVFLLVEIFGLSYQEAADVLQERVGTVKSRMHRARLAMCEALAIPVTGGNVSFYNETLGRAILPTPVIGVVGLLEDAERLTTQWFKEEGDRVVLLSARPGRIRPAVTWLSWWGSRPRGEPPRSARPAATICCCSGHQAWARRCWPSGCRRSCRGWRRPPRKLQHMPRPPRRES